MRNTFAIIVAVILAIALLSGVYLFYTQMPEQEKANSAVQQEAKKTVQLAERLPITVDLPAGYALFVEEGFEGVYAAGIDIMRQEVGGRFVATGVKIIISGAPDVDVVAAAENPRTLIDENEYFLSSEQVVLLGNPAVRYSGDHNTFVRGFLTAEQLDTEVSMGMPMEVTVSHLTYGRGTVVSEDFFDDIVESLRLQIQK